MPHLTNEAQEQLRAIAQRYGVSVDAAQSLLDSLMRGSGSMAQFNHPELGGFGQWMRGGMIMVGDMFNNGLKATVDGLCTELSRLLDNSPFVPTPYNDAQGSNKSFGFVSGWWPVDLGSPSSSGSQNDLRYAYFAGPRRLAIEQNGIVTIYDTLDHQIGGVSQQQGSNYSLAFTSQYGTVNLQQLPIVSSNAPNAPNPPSGNGGSAKALSTPAQAAPAPSSHGSEQEHDVFAKIERLAALKEKGLLTEDEFATKKAELLARL